MLTVAMAAKALGLKEPTIRLYIAKRKLDYVKLGRAVRIPEAAVQRMIQENTVPACRER